MINSKYAFSFLFIQIVAIHILFVRSTEGPVKHPLKTAEHT